MTIFKRLLTTLIIGILLIIISYQWLDRPIVYWAATHGTQQYAILKWLTDLTTPLVVIVFLTYPTVMGRFYYYHKLNDHDRALLALANSVAITYFLKDTLKSIFARYWPDTWINNNPSLLHDHAYGFIWFNTNQAYRSFPSGHLAITVAAMTMVWIAYPRWRWLAVLLIIIMMISEVSLYYHFLSDAIAGALLGYLVAKGIADMNNYSSSKRGNMTGNSPYR